MSIIGAIGSGYSPYRSAAVGTSAVAGTKPILNPNASTAKAPGRVSSPAECETCKNRKYQDGSDEMVSFKSAQHISPQSAPARVRGHEAEHVSNAYKDAAMNNGKVLQASVSIKTAVCPECGRTYVSGGTTTTLIASKKQDPYSKNARSSIEKRKNSRKSFRFVRCI